MSSAQKIVTSDNIIPSEEAHDLAAGATEEKIKGQRQNIAVMILHACTLGKYQITFDGKIYSFNRRLLKSSGYNITPEKNQSEIISWVTPYNL